MFRFESFDDEKLEKMLLDEISDDIITMASYSAKYVIAASPVDTGLFKGNWNVSIDEPYSGAFIHEDPSGSETLSKMEFEIETFKLKQDSIIHIQNSVVSLEDDERYAPTVAWDYSTSTADSIVSGAAIIGAGALR